MANPKPILFDEFYEGYITSFDKDHPYCAELYTFYRKAYVGHEEEFGELVDSWSDIYTFEQFSEIFYGFLRDCYNACGDMMEEEYEKFLGLGKQQYVSNLKVLYCRSYGVELYNKNLCGGSCYGDCDYFDEITKEEDNLIKNSSLELPKPSGKFKIFKGFYE